MLKVKDFGDLEENRKAEMEKGFIEKTLLEQQLLSWKQQTEELQSKVIFSYFFLKSLIICFQFQTKCESLESELGVCLTAKVTAEQQLMNLTEKTEECSSEQELLRGEVCSVVSRSSS